ncbi:hypothetical protein EYF80_015365 [Liparis tanakae]|uniref:Uncharacterized protein n=1 Tax=Liparis tanakae TaxID=230148 RepID=A0A4Z2I8Q7_9TELE|nr:hypothetical protein EYF80_015365 [Liparis tanakae]
MGKRCVSLIPWRARTEMKEDDSCSVKPTRRFDVCFCLIHLGRQCSWVSNVTHLQGDQKGNAIHLAGRQNGLQLGQLGRVSGGECQI